MGSEFIYKQFKTFLADNNIELYHTFNEGKAVVIERFNRTLKEKMWLRFTVEGNKKWVHMLPDLIKDYNNSFHRMIKATPVFASRKENENKIRMNMEETRPDTESSLEHKPNRFKVGDLVRIYRY